MIHPPRKVFEVLIYDKPYDVYDIDGREHEGWNGEPKTWWLYHSDRLPEGTCPPVDSPYWVPYHSRIQRHCWDIRFVQKNTTKEKWGETQFRNHTSVQMICNGRLVYSFGSSGTDRGLSFAMAKVQYLQTHMSEHCFNFFEPQKEHGRKIYWYGLPATVSVWRENEPWLIGIVPDYTAGLTKDQWWKEYERRKTFNPPKDDDDFPIDEDNEDQKRDFINWGDALSDEHINWFRNDKKNGTN